MNKRTSAEIGTPLPDKRLFIGLYPAGIVYADRTQIVDGDYRRLAFLSYETLELEWRREVPPALAQAIISDAQSIQARRGELFQVTAGGQAVLLGSN